MTEAREDRLTVLAHLDMLMVDRLRAWAHNIHTYGANIRQWGDPTFVGTEMNRIAADIEAAVKIGGQMGDELAALRAEHDRLRAERDEAQKRVDHWRGWARFVYMRGGPDDPTKTDGELQMAVAEAHDDHERDLGDRLQAEVDAHKRAESSVQALRQAADEILDGFKLESGNGVVCSIPDAGIDAPTSRVYCKRCKARYQRLAALALPGEAAQETRTCQCGHTEAAHPFGWSEGVVCAGHCWNCDCREFRLAAQETQTKEAEMEYEVLQSKGVLGEWRVEAIGPDGECYVTLFSGPNAESRARSYAQWVAAQEK